jgi:hypothetical protein
LAPGNTPISVGAALPGSLCNLTDESTRNVQTVSFEAPK